MADTDIAVDLTKRLPRGAIPSPRHELAAAMPHVPDPAVSVPPSYLMWPVQMSSWNNYIYGDCVSAEEAFAKATAAICAACQKECEKHADVPECVACAKSCKDCAAECRKVAA